MSRGIGFRGAELRAATLTIAIAAAMAAAPSRACAEGEGEAKGGRVFGRIGAEYRFERAELESGRDVDDHDVFARATLGTEKLLLENLETKVTARWSKDLDDRGSEASGRNEWIDLRDTRYGSRQLLFVSQAYARLTELGGLVDVTGGRQYVQEVEWAHFDGISAASDRRQGNPWSAGGFVGRRVDFWRTTEHQVVGGGHLGWRLGALDLAASDVYLVRNSLELKASATPEEPLGGFLDGSAQVSWKQIDERPDLGRILLNPRSDASGTDVTLLYEHKFNTGRKTFSFDYVSIDGDIDRLRFTRIAPYDRIEGKIWQRIAGPLGAFAGLDWLRLVHEGDADGFNSSYMAPSGGLDISGWPTRGTTASTRVSYSDFHRPPLRAGTPFDDLRGTGEEDWFEVQAEVRQSFGRVATVGFEYVYEEFDARTRFARTGRINSNSFRLYGKVRPVEGLAIRVDLFLTEDLPNVYEDGLDRAEGVWASVEYSF